MTSMKEAAGVPVRFIRDKALLGMRTRLLRGLKLLTCINPISGLKIQALICRDECIV